MEKTLQELKTIIRELIIEVGELKEKVSYLEKANQESTYVSQPATYTLSLEGESYENLGKIYKEGFHVCPMSYGRPRNGDCLFCVAFMEKG
ncbi:MAG: initiation control protein YabA [Syntrophomonadaceae bacterium]|nr:initiation control protein YabA [Syntrophomonadaceae bacterium]MDD3890032.1 initiation control protein YabA [Syntrophomonadaceae bacterium]MDD4549849.1 initiation control protein YabA [Syntrophomonadaceae bacterium]